MRKWNVLLPMAGHLAITVKADDEESAIKKAMDSATIDDLEGWDILRRFNRGNVCYCPSPWEVEVTLEADDED